MALYSYLLAYDSGSAPNPFHGYCTLAICKPGIRRTAQVGDWVMATGRKHSCGYRKLVYAMQVGEILTLEDYFRDKRFRAKRPEMKSTDWRDWVGDNIYRRNADGTITQLPGVHAGHDIEKDMRGKNVLIGDHFYYFGREAAEMPASFGKLIHANQGHRKEFPQELVGRFLNWLEGKFEVGVHGEPVDRPEEACGGCGEEGAAGKNCLHGNKRREC